MSEEAKHELIIVRRHEEDEEEHHSSAWKVAHADFMTAMMAFFLIMWLINVTDEEIRKGISAYFNPIYLAEGQSEMKGLNEPNTTELDSGAEAGHSNEASPAGGTAEAAAADGNSVEKADAHAAKSDASEAAAGAGPPPIAHEEAPPGESAAVVAGGETEGEGEAAAAADPQAGEEKAGGEAAGQSPSEGSEHGKVAGGGTAETAEGERERAAFQDPYAILAKLAAQYAASHPMSSDAIIGDPRLPGLASGEADRDPFDPIYWQMNVSPPVRADQPGDPRSVAPAPETGIPDAAAAMTRPDGAEAPPPPAATAMAPVAASPPTEAKPPMALPPADARVPAAPPPAAPAPVVMKAEHGADAATVKAAEALRNDLGQSLKGLLASPDSPRLEVKATGEGILIDLTDNIDFSMFEIGSAIPNPKVVVVMQAIAKVLAARAGEVVVRGHTDGRPFRSDVYDNWRLSAARAHMANYMLVRGGLAETRVGRIEGYADRRLKVAADPYSAQNRRIEILLKEASP